MDNPPPADSVTVWLEHLKAGDPAAAGPLWERYFARLVTLARARLRLAPRAARDEEDVALSAFHNFCRGVEAGRFPRLDDRDDLWQVLFMITTCKAAALARHGLTSDLVPPRYRSGYFAHVFAHSYDAGYYSYLWSEVLDADMVDWFEENGGLRRENGDVFRDRLLSRGSSVDPLEAFAAVRGRTPSPEPLLRRRGLV